jgi:hypothetical protein
MRIKYLPLFILTVITFCSCKKSTLNEQDTIIGTWYIKNMRGVNGFSNTSALDFNNGFFTFKENGLLQYKNTLTDSYNGKWELYEKPDETSTDADGNTTTIEYNYTVLELQVQKQTGAAQKKEAYFVQFKFIDANNFRAELCPAGVVIFEYSFVRGQ